MAIRDDDCPPDARPDGACRFGIPYFHPYYCHHHYEEENDE